MDIAALGIEVDSRDVRTSTSDLDRFHGASKRADTGARDFSRGATQAATATQRLAMEAETARMRIARLATGFLAFTAATFGIRAVVGTLADFEQSMAAVAAVTRATGEELTAMRDIAKELGATTEFTASQAAEGLRFLGMAGFTAAEATAALPAVLDLATAGAIGLAEASDIASNIMSGFRIEATRATEVTDVMAAVASRANTNIFQLGDAMKYVAPIAAGMNISVADTAAAIGVLSDAGIQGSMAGTGLRMALVGLLSPSNEARTAIEALGLRVSDVNPLTNDLADIMSRLAEAGLDVESALAIAGPRGGNALQTLVSAVPRLRELTEELQNVEGAASDMATTMRDQLGGDIKAMASAAESIVIAFGESGFTGVLRTLFQLATTVMRAIADNIELVTIVVVALTARFVAARIAGAAWFQLMARQVVVIAALNGGLTLATARFLAFNAAMAAGSRILAMFGGPIGLALTGIAAVIALWATRGEQANRVMEQHENVIRRVRDAYEAANGEARGLLETMEDINLIDLVRGFTDDRDEFSRLLSDFGQRARGGVMVEDLFGRDSIVSLQGLMAIALQTNSAFSNMVDQIIVLSDRLASGQMDARAFAAEMDALAVATEGVNDPVARGVNAWASYLLTQVQSKDGVIDFQNALVEAVQTLELFEDQLTPAQRAQLDLVRHTLELIGAFNDLGGAGHGAAGGINAAGSAARQSIADFLGAANAVDAFAGALRGLSGIAAPELTDLQQVGQFVTQGASAIGAGLMANMGPLGFDIGAIGAAMDAWVELRTNAERAVSRIVAEETAFRTDLIAGVELDAQVNALEGQERAVAALTVRYQGLLQELHESARAQGLTAASQEEVNALMAAYNTELAAIQQQYANSSGGGGGGSQGVFSQTLERTLQSIEALRQEAAMLGMSEAEAAAYRVEMELLNAARQEGIALSPAEVDYIRQVAAAYGEATAELIRQQEQMDAARERFENWKSATKDFFSTFISGLREGKTAMEALGDALGRLADRLIDMALNMAINALFNSLAGLAGGGDRPILSALFGFATGGLVMGAGNGTSDSNLVRVSDGEFIVNAQATRQNLALLHAINDNRMPVDYGGNVTPIREMPPVAPSGGGGITIKFEPHIDARGSNITQAEIKAALRQAKKELFDELPDALAKLEVNRRF